MRGRKIIKKKKVILYRGGKRTEAKDVGWGRKKKRNRDRT